MVKKIGIIKGSLRKNSFSQSMVDYVISHAPEGCVFELIDISGLPLYNQDYDQTNPEDYAAFRSKVREFDGLLFITPEYNRSIPAALKNALDIGSRPMGESVWDGKPGAIISLSPGAIGGFGSNHHLRQVFTVLNILTLAQPEAYIGGYHTLLDENGVLSNTETQEFIGYFLASFKSWVEKLS